MPDTPAPPQGPHPNVVVVDDDPNILHSTCEVIEHLGYGAVPCEDPSDVLSAATLADPVVILLDLRMPGANIPGILAALRSDEKTSSVPVVFFSANPDIAHTASRYDAWGYLEKPFSSNQLSQLIQRAAARRMGNGASDNPAARRDARTSFHEYWNTLGALTNYAFLLREDQGLDERQRTLANNLDDAILRLQAQTERLQRYIMAMIG